MMNEHPSRNITTQLTQQVTLPNSNLSIIDVHAKKTGKHVDSEDIGNLLDFLLEEPSINDETSPDQLAAFLDAKKNEVSRSSLYARMYFTLFPYTLSNIAIPSGNDVLCGRGKRVNSHEGNIRFRAIMRKYKLEYLLGPSGLSTSKKSTIVAKVVLEIRSLSPPGRFLELDKDSGLGLWHDIGDVRARTKVGQGLRAGAKIFRKTWEPEKILEDSQPQRESQMKKGNKADFGIVAGKSNERVPGELNNAIDMPALIKTDEVIADIQNQIEE